MVEARARALPGILPGVNIARGGLVHGQASPIAPLRSLVQRAAEPAIRSAGLKQGGAGVSMSDGPELSPGLLRSTRPAVRWVRPLGLGVCLL